MTTKTWLLIATIFFAMLYIWPNVIHEPMHYAALKLQGSEGTINFDWMHYPAHPSTTRTAPVAGILGGLFFILAPSLLSLVILIAMTMRKRLQTWEGAIALYVAVDLILNIYTSKGAISDFKFLTVLPYGAAIAFCAIGVVMVLTAIIALRVGMAVEHGRDTTSGNNRVLARTGRDGGVHSPSARLVARRDAAMDSIHGRQWREKNPRARLNGIPQISTNHPNTSDEGGRAE